jgi:hypothetical protein
VPRWVPCGCPTVAPGAPAPKDQLPSLVYPLCHRTSAKRLALLPASPAGDLSVSPVPSVLSTLRLTLPLVSVPSEPPPLRVMSPSVRSSARVPLTGDPPFGPASASLSDPISLAGYLLATASASSSLAASLCFTGGAESTGLGEIRRLSTGKACFPLFVPRIIHSHVAAEARAAPDAATDPRRSGPRTRTPRLPCDEACGPGTRGGRAR